jgi:hypothetical protein
MKKLSKVAFAILSILTMLFSFVQVSTALAKKVDTDVDLEVRNRTGHKVTLLLTDQDGRQFTFVYGPGWTDTKLTEGLYRYYATTVCGNQSGVFNLNVTKYLFFSCGDGLDIQLGVPDFVGSPDNPPVATPEPPVEVPPQQCDGACPL